MFLLYGNAFLFTIHMLQWRDHLVRCFNYHLSHDNFLRYNFCVIFIIKAIYFVSFYFYGILIIVFTVKKHEMVSLRHAVKDRITEKSITKRFLWSNTKVKLHLQRLKKRILFISFAPFIKLSASIFSNMNRTINSPTI